MPVRDPLHSTHVSADRLMVGVLWCLAALSFALAPWHQTWLWAFAIGRPAAPITTVKGYGFTG
jgi:methyl-accepting chemotaxis protein